MTDFARSRRWSVAYHAQACSDFMVFELLCASAVPPCHALHYLQMAAEKTAKAYALAWEPTRDPEDVQCHAVIVPFVQNFLRRPNAGRRWRSNSYAIAAERKRVAGVAREIELLAPAVDSVRSPRNAEYAWEVAENVIAPVFETFGDLALRSRDMVRFLKTIRMAIDEFRPEP